MLHSQASALLGEDRHIGCLCNVDKWPVTLCKWPVAGGTCGSRSKSVTVRSGFCRASAQPMAVPNDPPPNTATCTSASCISTVVIRRTSIT